MKYKFKIGDRVKIRSDRGPHWDHAGEMDDLCNRLATIESCADGNFFTSINKYYLTIPNYNQYWVFDEEDLTAAETDEDIYKE